MKTSVLLCALGVHMHGVCVCMGVWLCVVACVCVWLCDCVWLCGFVCLGVAVWDAVGSVCLCVVAWACVHARLACIIWFKVGLMDEYPTAAVVANITSETSI